MDASPKLTIATVTFNCLSYTKLFLESLKNYAGVPYNLIIIDNHSTDGTVKFLKKQEDLSLILNKRNFGFGWGNNQAFRLCQTPYFLGINNDTVIFPGFLPRLLQIAEAHPEYGEFGVHSNCIGALDPRTGKDTRIGLKELEDKSNSPRQIVRRYYGDFGKFLGFFSAKNRGILEFEVPPNFIGGWCFLVRYQAVRKAGGLFDKRFKIGFWEDVDLSWRLAKSGYKIGLIRELYLHHFNHVSFKLNKLRASDHAISRTNGLRFGEKWSEEIKDFLKVKFRQGMTLREIMKKYFIFNVYFKGNENISAVENSLKKGFIGKQMMNFREFLLMTKKGKIRSQ